MKTGVRVATKRGVTAIAVEVTAEECRFRGIRWLSKSSDRLRAGLTDYCVFGTAPIIRAVASIRSARLLSSILVIACTSGIGQSVAQSAPASSKPQHMTVRHHKVEDEDPALAKLTQAEDAIAKNDYAAAEPLLKEVIETYPEQYAAWYDLGYVYHALGRREDSIAAYKKSVEAKPDVFESNLNLGLALAESSPQEAEHYLRTATQLAPASHPERRHKDAWMALGHLLEAGKPDQAIVAFRQAAAADPRDPEPHLLAGSLLEKDRPKEAEKEYQQALTIQPQSSDALAALTNLYMRQRQYPEAEDVLKKLVAVHPKDASAHLQLGRMLAISGKSEEATAELEAGLKLDPSDTKAQRDLADLYSDAGKYTQAQPLYASLLTAYPNDGDLHHGLGRVLLRQKKFADAEKELARAVELQPNSGTAWGDLAFAANENKDYAGVIRAVDMRAKYLPDTPITYFLRATAYDNLHNSKQAAAYYHEFLDTAGGKFPDQEWQAKHRLITLESKK